MDSVQLSSAIKKGLGSIVISYGMEVGIRIDFVQLSSAQQSYVTAVIQYGMEVLYIRFINMRERRTHGWSILFPNTYD